MKRVNVTLLLAAFVVLCLYVYSMFIQPWMLGVLLITLKEWQTFNGGMLALLAAGFSAFIIMRIDKNARRRDVLKAKSELRREQMKLRISQKNEDLRLAEKRKQIEDKRIRDLTAARALLPEKLKKIMEYTEAYQRYLEDAYLALTNGSSTETKREMIYRIQKGEVPTGHEQAFKECIGLAEIQDANELIYILNHLQIFSSRARSFSSNGHLSPSYTKEMLVDCIRFQFKIESLFDYARFGYDIKFDNHRNTSSYYIRLHSERMCFVELGKDPRLDELIQSAARRD